MEQAGASMTIQQEMMRHAIQSTMNVYGRAMSDGKREANSNVVQMVLRTTTPMGLVLVKVGCGGRI
jgi:integrase